LGRREKAYPGSPVNYRLIIRPEAETDLTEAYDWYESQLAGLGAEFLLVVEASLAAIQRNPKQYQVLHRGIRRALTRRFPFGIFYLIRRNMVIVLAVLHAKRDPQLWQQRP
jgi:plasmid stabilization system protein ParE